MARVRSTLTRLILICSANLLAALGGAVIFSAALHSLAERRILTQESGGAIVVYIYGSIVAILILTFSPARLKERGIGVFSLAAALSALLLILTLRSYPQIGAQHHDLLNLGVFVLLCAHFCFFICARGLRSDISAGIYDQLPWVELSFYLGWIIGLLSELAHEFAWVTETSGATTPVGGAESEPLQWAFGAAMILQVVAAGLDRAAISIKTDAPAEPDAEDAKPRPTSYNWVRYASLTASLAILTASIEGWFYGSLLQDISGGEEAVGTRKTLTTCALAVSYLGPACASVFYARYSVRLTLPRNESFERGREGRAGVWAAPLSLVIAVTTVIAGLLAFVPALNLWNWVFITPALLIIFFLLEIGYLVIGDQIGEEAKRAGRSGLVAVTLGLIALSMAVTVKLISAYETSGAKRAAAAVVLAVSAGVAYLALFFKGRAANTHVERVVAKIDPPEMTPAALARAVINRRSLPSYAFYTLPPNSAFWWAAFSREEVRLRRDYEGDAISALGVDAHLYKKSGATKVGLVGLAVGEGAGEVEILKRVLRDLGPDGRVHYLGIDMSPPLLLAHLDTLRDVFADELRVGRLNIAVMLGDMNEASKAVSDARREFSSRGISFLPDNIPLLITCLGNVLGNETEPDKEVTTVAAIRDYFPNRPLCVLAGVSVSRASADEYDHGWFEFLIQPLRYLSSLGLLVSKQTGDGDEPEGLPAVAPGDAKSHSVECVRRKSVGVNGNRTKIHDFYYNLRSALTLPGENLTLESGARVLLYSVTKYEVEGLAAAIESAGFKVHVSEHFQKIETVGEVREYAVFAALT